MALCSHLANSAKLYVELHLLKSLVSCVRHVDVIQHARCEKPETVL